MISRDSIVFRTLVLMARQRAGYDEHRCHALLEMLAAAEELRSTLRARLGAERVTELQFSVLVALLTADPDPCCPSTLAEHAVCNRTAVADVLNQLEARRLIKRGPDPDDRRLRLIRLTDAGREQCERCISTLLGALGELGRPLNIQTAQALMRTCALLAGTAGGPPLR